MSDPETIEIGEISVQFKAWKVMNDALLNEVQQPGFEETEESEARWSMNDALGDRIAKAKPATNADAAAMLEWLICDCDYLSIDEPDVYLHLLQSVATFLKEA